MSMLLAAAVLGLVVPPQSAPVTGDFDGDGIADTAQIRDVGGKRSVEIRRGAGGSFLLPADTLAPDATLVLATETQRIAACHRSGLDIALCLRPAAALAIKHSATDDFRSFVFAYRPGVITVARTVWLCPDGSCAWYSRYRFAAPQGASTSLPAGGERYVPDKLFHDQAAAQAARSAPPVSMGGRPINMDPAPLVPVSTRYTNGPVTLNLFAWSGRHVAVLSGRSDLPQATMRRLLNALDRTYEFYNDMTGEVPKPFLTYDGKPSVARTGAEACGGAACGYFGHTGVELGELMFDHMIEAITREGLFDQGVFYEFGRSFWFYDAQLSYKNGDGGGNGGAVATGFAEFMRFLAMEAAGVQGGEFHGYTFPEFRERLEQMLDLYLADPSQNWANTLRAGVAQRNNPWGYEVTKLFASFCFRLRRDYGGNAFVKRLWREAGNQPAAQTTYDAVDNFVVAASIAANRDLSRRFADEWRWPVSPAARNRIAQALR